MTSSSNHSPPATAAASAAATATLTVSAVTTVGLAVTNRVLNKMALVSLKSHPFFLAQVLTFGYVAVYFSMLLLRYHIGIVTRDMLQLPKVRFIVIGFLEALGVASGMAAGARLPGPAIPVLSQSYLLWQLIFSSLLLRRTYTVKQTTGCFLVTTGVVLAVASGTKQGQFLSEVKFIWVILMVLSSALHAAASIIKEFVFIDGAKRLKGRAPDIFVINSFGSGFQALFVFLLLPLLSNMSGIPFSELPAYINGGAECFLHKADDIPDCEGAPYLPLLYVAVNLAYNISLLNLVKISSAVLASLASTVSVPVSIYLLSLPLPYLPQATKLSSSFVLGTMILMLGLIIYNLSKPAQKQK